MFLAFHGQPTEINMFSYYLAEKLGKTVGEVEDMPFVEYDRWRAFYTVKAALDSRNG